MQRVSLEDVKEAMEDSSEETGSCYVYMPEGIVVSDVDEDFFDEDGLKQEYSEDDFVQIPDQSYFNEYQNMKDFAETRTGQEKEWLENAIRGAGAFRRFRGTLNRFGIEDDWYDFSDRAHLLSAAEWCEENGIPYDAGNALDVADLPLQKESSQKKAAAPVYRIGFATEKNSGLLTDMAAALLKDLKETDGLDMLRGQELIEDEMNEGNVVLTAMDQGRPVGFAIVEQSGTRNLMRYLYVRPAVRRRGIGRSLVQKAVEEHADLLFLVQPCNENGSAFLSAVGYDHPLYLIVGK